MLEMLAILFISLLPSYIISLIDKRLNDLERICLSLGLSFLMISSFSLVLKYFGINIFYSFFISIAVSVFLFLTLAKQKTNILPRIPSDILAVLVISFVLRLLLQNFVQVPTTGDAFSHLTYANSFTTNDWFTVNYLSLDSLNCKNPPCPVEYRPPFFNFILGFFFNLFGSSFEIAKQANVLISTIMLIPVYLIASMLGGKRLAFTSVILIAFVPIFIGLSIESEVRLLAIYLSLTAIYFFLKNKNSWLYVGIFLGLLYLTHYPEAIATILSIPIFLVAKEKKQLFKSNNFKILIILLLIVSPWLVRNVMLFGSPLHSSSIKLTLTNNPNELFSKEQPSLSSFLSQPLSEIITKKVTGFIRSLFPLPFKEGKIDFNVLNNQNLTSNSISSLVTPPLIILSILFLVRNRKNKIPSFILTFFLTSLILSMITIGGNDIYTYAVMLPSSTLLIISGAHSIGHLKDKNKKIVWIVIILFLITQIPFLYSRFDPKKDFSQDWILENTREDEKLMVRWTNAAVLNYFTGRTFYAMPFENADYIKQYAVDNDVSYLIIDTLDLNQGKISLDSLNQEFTLQYIYNTTDRFNLRETYWVFKV